MIPNPFRAGAAKTDITPPLGTLINGNFVAHYACFVHDPLYAKAIVFEHQDVTLAIVVVDICVMPRDFLDDVKARIFSQVGIPPAHVLISSTHTHAAGSVAEVHLVGADLGYRSRLPVLLVEAVRLARQQLQPAQLGFGTVDAPEHVVCRRYFMRESYTAQNPVTGGGDAVKTNPLGAEADIVGRVARPDSAVSFLGVRTPAGRWLGLLANYSLHYVGDWDNGTLSADYFGEFSRQISLHLGADESFVGLMSNGTSGDVNIWDFMDNNRYPTENFAKSRFIGEALADQVFGALAGVHWQNNPRLAARYHELTVATNRPSPAELARARAVVADTNYAQLVPDDDGLRRIYAREQLMLHEFPASLTCPVQAFQLGETIIGGLPGEFFAATGLALKQQFPAYFTIGLANGNVGYVPPANELARGGYETWRCRISCLEAAAEEKFRDCMVQLISELIVDPA